MARRTWALVAAILAAASVASCNGAPVGTFGDGGRGRYVGVGIYRPGVAWTKIAAAEPKTANAAKREDDQAIIVVEDSLTGELRACGDLTGYCIGTNPWRRMLATSQVAPISVTAHELSSDYDREPAPETNTPETNAAASTR